MRLQASIPPIGRLRVLIALAIVALALPSAPLVGPARQAGSKPAGAWTQGLRRAVDRLSRLAFPHESALADAGPAGESPLANNEEESTPPAAEPSDAEDSESPDDLGDLAEALARLEAIASRRAGDRTARAASVEAATAPADTSAGRLGAFRRATIGTGGADLPVRLCRLTC